MARGSYAPLETPEPQPGIYILRDREEKHDPKQDRKMLKVLVPVLCLFFAALLVVLCIFFRGQAGCDLAGMGCEPVQYYAPITHQQYFAHVGRIFAERMGAFPAMTHHGGRAGMSQAQFRELCRHGGNINVDPAGNVTAVLSSEDMQQFLEKLVADGVIHNTPTTRSRADDLFAILDHDGQGEVFVVCTRASFDHFAEMYVPQLNVTDRNYAWNAMTRRQGNGAQWVSVVAYYDFASDYNFFHTREETQAQAQTAGYPLLTDDPSGTLPVVA